MNKTEPTIDLSGMALSDLEHLRDKVSERIEVVREEMRTTAFETIEKVASEGGLSLEDLRAKFGAKGSTKRRTPTEPKYLHPNTGEKWTGKGRPPNWVKAFTENGGDLESLAIKKEK